MEVRIIPPKEDDMPEMTIQELLDETYIGVEYGGFKYFNASLDEEDVFVRANSSLVYRGTKEEVLKGVIGLPPEKMHIFDTPNELYRWMAEDN